MLGRGSVPDDGIGKTGKPGPANERSFHRMGKTRSVISPTRYSAASRAFVWTTQPLAVTGFNAGAYVAKVHAASVMRRIDKAIVRSRTDNPQPLPESASFVAALALLKSIWPA